MSSVVALGAPGAPRLPEELEAAFREHSRFLLRAACSVTGRLEDAEDVVQALFLLLWRRGLPPEFGRNPKAYLYRAAINLALNSIRARRRQPSGLDPIELQIVADARSGNPGASERPNLRERLAAAMAQLNPRAAEMLVLRYTEGYSDAEIGRLLGTSRGVVAVTLFRARARMKTLLRTSTGDE